MSQQRVTVPKTGLPVRFLIVPLDGSPFAERAVDPAAHLGTALGASMHLVSAAETASEAEARRAELRSLAAAHGASWEVVVGDDPAAALESAGGRHTPALVCMATHGRGRSAALMGSVATAILSRWDLPTLLIGPKASLDESQARRLVVCVDGTPATEPIVPVAVAWAAALGMTVSIVTVAEPVPESVRMPGHYSRLHGPDIDADQYVSSLVDPWRNAGVAIDGTAVYDPVSVAGGMRNHLATEHASMVVLGTRARTGLPRLVLGSAAATVVHESPIPALVVPID